MGRVVGGIVVGYIVMAVVVFVTFTLAYRILGVDGSFQPGSYEVTGTWAVVSILLGLLGAILGGMVAVAVARKSGAAKGLAVFVLFLGLGMAVMEVTRPNDQRPTVRAAEVSNTDAMQNARQPLWLLWMNPLIGAAGVMIGGKKMAGRIGSGGGDA
jgi:hypothetical protein